MQIRSSFRLFGLVVAGLSLSEPVSAEDAKPDTVPSATPLTVVELYTSQGCSSCPPADSFLGELARREDILALSFHVDYWDYIGWQDPFADAMHTARQRDYAHRFDLRYVYTPQMIIQGVVEMPGSRREAVLEQFERLHQLPRVTVGLSRTAPGGLLVHIDEAPETIHPSGHASVWLVTFDALHETTVERGENQGRTMRNVNVVRSFARIGMWAGEAADLEVTELPKGDGCAVLIQQDRTGRILGAAALALHR